jgi:hypothetical protein
MSASATRLIVELCDVTRDWDRHQKLLPLEQEVRARAIGMELYQLGGEALMQDAYYEAHAMNPAASIVQALWDGIGEWRW